MEMDAVSIDMGVSKNNGTPKIIHFNRVFHYVNHPFWGVCMYPYFWKHPYMTKLWRFITLFRIWYKHHPNHAELPLAPTNQHYLQHHTHHHIEWAWRKHSLPYPKFAHQNQPLLQEHGIWKKQQKLKGLPSIRPSLHDRRNLSKPYSPMSPKKVTLLLERHYWTILYWII